MHENVLLLRRAQLVSKYFPWPQLLIHHGIVYSPSICPDEVEYSFKRLLAESFVAEISKMQRTDFHSNSFGNVRENAVIVREENLLDAMLGGRQGASIENNFLLG